MNNRKRFLLIYILGVISISVPIAASDSPDVKELLRRFTEVRENFTSFIVECESENTFNNPQLNRSSERYAKVEYRFDGTRSRVRVFWWGNVDIRSPNVSKDQAHYSSELWDGENRYWYNRTAPSDLGLVQIRRIRDPGGVPKEQTDIIKGKNIVGEMMGYHWGDNGKRVDEILDIAECLELRKNKKKLRGVDCYVIDSVVKGKGKYKLWIDPIHDYHIAKIHVWRKEGDYVHTRMAKKNQSTNEMFEILRFQKIGDSWFPLEYKMERTIIDNGRLSKENKTTTITNIVLNPDHDALKSFIPDDIPNGATANIVAFPSSLEFIWQDGKVVDKTGRVIMDSKTKKPAGSTSEPKSKSQTKKRITVSELLDKYAVTQDKFRCSFIGKLEVCTKYEGVSRARPSMKRGQVYEMNRKIELRSDGDRLYLYQKIWGRSSIRNTSEEEAYVGIRLWDDETFYHYRNSLLSRTNKNGTVILSYPKNPSYSWLWQRGPGRTLRGYFPGVEERIDTELRQATTISVEPQREDINGSQCYVINARTKGTKGCEFRIWIDPEHDYNIAKAIVKRDWASWGSPKLQPKDPKGNAEVELRNVRFKKIDDVWLPVEADYRRENEYVNGDYEKDFTHLKITEFVMNPDHDALGSFKHDFIPNGARVRLAGVPGITYTWKDGKVVDKQGRVIADFRKKAGKAHKGKQ